MEIQNNPAYSIQTNAELLAGTDWADQSLQEPPYWMQQGLNISCGIQT